MTGISVNNQSKTVRVYAFNRQHYFPFRRYGGLAHAYAAALDFIASLPASEHDKKYHHTVGFGASGIAGVGKYVIRGDHVGWVAYYQSGPPGQRKQIQKKFRFSHYGNFAIAAAAEWRAQMIEENF